MTSNQEVVKQVEAEVSEVVTQVEKLKIENNDQYVAAGEILKNVKSAEKVIKTRKEEITKPLNAALKSARALFKPVETQLSDSKTNLLTVMGEFKRKQDAIAAEKARKLEEKIAKGTIKNPETIMKNLDKIEKADNLGAGITETTRRVVTVPDWTKLNPQYIMELLDREGVSKAVMVEIRKDALGNKTAGIEPRIEAGVEVTEEKAIF